MAQLFIVTCLSLQSQGRSLSCVLLPLMDPRKVKQVCSACHSLLGHKSSLQTPYGINSDPVALCLKANFLRVKCWLKRKLALSGAWQLGEKVDSSPRTNSQLLTKGQGLLKGNFRGVGRWRELHEEQNSQPYQSS